MSQSPRRPVHGVLLLDKPLGLSSNNALQKCKWLLRAEKAGHTGTLDPLATGVLPLCFGAATKFSQLQLEADKIYEALLVLGITTSTADAEGEVTATAPVPPLTAQLLEQVRQQFTGAIQQVPPMYSALKKDGKALYDYARSGQVVEREPRSVTVHALSLTPGAPTAQGSPTLVLRTTVSKGTYIRTLGEDIAQAIGCGGHLGALRRLATGHYALDQCVSLEHLESLDEDQRTALLLPAQSLLAGHEQVTLNADHAARFLSGLRRRGDWANHPAVAVFGPAPETSAATQDDVLLGTGHTQGGELIPGRLLSPIEIQQILRIRELQIA